MTDAPTIGVVGSADVASALREIGFQVITGAEFRPTATAISDRLNAGGDFPLVVADQQNAVALSPWTQKVASQTHVVVLGTAPGIGLLEGKPNRLELPATVNDLLGMLRYQATLRPVGEKIIGVDGTVGAVAPAPLPLPLPLPEPEPVSEGAPAVMAPTSQVPVETVSPVPDPAGADLPETAHDSQTQGFPDGLFDGGSGTAHTATPTAQPVAVAMETPRPSPVLPPAPVRAPVPEAPETDPAWDQSQTVASELEEARVALDGISPAWEERTALVQEQHAPMPVERAPVLESVETPAVSPLPSPSAPAPAPTPVARPEPDMAPAPALAADPAYASPHAGPARETPATTMSGPSPEQQQIAPAPIPQSYVAPSPSTHASTGFPAVAPSSDDDFFDRRATVTRVDPVGADLPRRPHGTVGEVIIDAAGKGGVGKTTTSIELAQICAEAGLSAIIIDANRGQSDIRKYLRLGDAPLRTAYDAYATGDPSAAVIRPADYAHLRQEARLDTTDFALVLGPPSDLSSPEFVSAAVYGQIVDYARSIADVVIIDTQIIEAHRTDLWDDLLIPLLRGDAWLVAITDESSPGVSNLKERLTEIQQVGVPNGRTLILATQYDNFTDDDSRYFQSRFQSLGTLIGATSVDLNFHNQMNRGRVVSDSPAIAPTMKAILHRVTGRSDLFAPAPEEPGRRKGGFLSGLFGGKR